MPAERACLAVRMAPRQMHLPAAHAIVFSRYASMFL